MNKLKLDVQTRLIGALVEGCSIRSVERMTGVHRDTIMRLGVRVGEGCKSMLDERMRGLTCREVEVDELWCYVQKKQRFVQAFDPNRDRIGDTWTFVAIDRNTKLIPAFRVGKRTTNNAVAFMNDLASRLDNRCQLSSDGMKAYLEACDAAFKGEVDYGQIVKSYEAEALGPGRYSPPRVASTEKTAIAGNPDFARICTSHVERQNLTMRMQMRRFTRLTNAFSKKLENLEAAVALHFAHYNFARVHKTLRVTPAMEAGIADHVWTLEEIAGLAS